ncbi:hypothetical protein JKG47_12145 [Acidithiobacillus sp. MC6.1]|nr:hypothetical protein [Acidithiobacillus sp. MC6.1]
MADALEARDRYYYVQLHSWTGGKRFFDYQTGPAQSEEKGFLTKVAEASQTEGWTVVCLDEMDKAPESFEALFQDWLQTGRVPGKPGEHLYTNLDRLLVLVTSNGMRESGLAVPVSQQQGAGE